MSFVLRRPRVILLIVILALIGSSLTPLRATFSSPFFKLSSGSSRTIRTSGSSTSSTPEKFIDAHVSLGSILDQIAITISNSISTFDRINAHQELGINLDNSDVEQYKAELQSYFQEFFANTSQPDLLSNILSGTSLLPETTKALPKNVYTTDLAIPSELPEQFHSWATMNPDWRTNFVSDGSMDDWISSGFPGGGGIVREMRALGDSRGIVRADLFRYVQLNQPTPIRL